MAASVIRLLERDLPTAFRNFLLCSRAGISGTVKPGNDEVKRVKVDADTLDLVQKMSLVDFSDDKGITTLESAIEFADQMMEVKIGNDVEPMYSVQEDRSLFMRNDVVTEGNQCKNLMQLASKTEEEYYVAPPGNVPLRKP